MSKIQDALDNFITNRRAPDMPKEVNDDLEIIFAAAKQAANIPDAKKVRGYFVANMMDGDDGGVTTMSMKTLADEATQIVGFILEDAELIEDAYAWADLGVTE